MSTYNQLIKDVVAYSHRDDLDLKIPLFIQLAELNMFSNDVEPLLVKEQEVTSTTTSTGKVIALPAEFERMRAISLVKDGVYQDLQQRAPHQMRKRSGVGRPLNYTIIGEEIEFDITPDFDYTIELQYFRRATPISVDNQTNFILDNHYQVYLFGALIELFGHVLDAEQEQRYTVRFYKAIKGANKADKKSRYGVAPIMSVEGMTP